MFWLFAVAGNETLRNGLPGASIALVEHSQDRLICPIGRLTGDGVRARLTRLQPGDHPECQWVPLGWTGAVLVMGRGLGHVRSKGPSRAAAG